MANSHPFFSGVTVDGAADWTAQYLIDQEPRYATQAGKPLYSAEIGWPTDAMAGGSFSAVVVVVILTLTAGSLTLNGSVASIPDAQTLIDTFVCAANTNITAGGPYANGYFWFGTFSCYHNHAKTDLHFQNCSIRHGRHNTVAQSLTGDCSTRTAT